MSKYIDCPRAKSDSTPCCARDGDLAMSHDGHCVGCFHNVAELFKELVSKYISLKKERVRRAKEAAAAR